jgi:hypothetical protein
MKRWPTKHNKNFQDALLERQTKAAELAKRLTVCMMIIATVELLVAILGTWPH